ncbi:hypothetical protein KI387_033181 [Taxus chinensis]|uniref:Bifunctional inhibitor/plant lipid transfer protein/seed storage helical domain-containing protein n=1 Tax=Taxus chinensis TaxID=29808 RepID=A0AA38C115_TAXCH|nr:hypothetical protein KI387_033181 [Taxus chinensis]
MDHFLGKTALIAVIVVVITAAGRNGVVNAQTPSSGCTTSLLAGLSPCISFFNASNGISPPQGCCTAFASVVETSAACICQLFSFMPTGSLPSPLPSGFPINQTQALNLPAACQITTAPCTGAGVSPTTSPDVSGTTTATDGPSTVTAEAPSASFPSAPSAVGIAPSSPRVTSDAKALFTPSFFRLCWALILGSLLL